MKIVLAKDYGIEAGSNECQLLKVKRMLDENRHNACFQFEAGQYHFYQRNAEKVSMNASNSDFKKQMDIGIRVEQGNDLIIDGQGAEFVYHGDIAPIVISDCRNAVVKNLSIDFACPLSAEARVLDAKRNAVRIFLDRKIFPWHIDKEQLIFERGSGETAVLSGVIEFDAYTNRVRAGAGDTFPEVKVFKEEENIVRMEGDFSVLPKAGNILVLRHGKRVHPGIFIQYSEDVFLENIHIYHTGGLGVLCQFTNNISVQKLFFGANTRRGFTVLSGHDDGLHFSNVKGVIVVEGCSFRGLMDDSINIHGTAVCIKEKTDDHTILCEYRHYMSDGFERWALPGDEIDFIDPDSRQCYAKAKVLEYRLLNRTQFLLRIEDKTPDGMKAGDGVENVTNTPFVVCRRNYFGSGRARGLLVTTPKPVLIEDNIFETSGCAILLAGDVREWYESGNCTDVKIRGNRFQECLTSRYQFCKGVIHIEPGVTRGIVHRNIQISDNLFLLASHELLYAEHTGKVKFENNWIVMNRYTEDQSPKNKFYKCQEIQCENNTIIRL